MKALSGKLYVGGAFTQIGTAYYSGLAAWSFSGSTWAEVEGGVGGYVFDIDAYTSGLTEHVLVGGEFGHVGGNTVVQAANIADRVKDVLSTRWRRLVDPDGPGADLKGYNQRVTALLRDSQGNLYMGGCMEPGGLVDGIGRWDGTRWVPLGSGLSMVPGCVTAMAIGSDDTLYAAGEFDAGYGTFRMISRWTGTIWNDIAIDIDGTINAMVVGQDGTLYVGGDFSSINGTNEISSRLIQYSSPGSWSNVGSEDITNSVRSLAISKTTGDLYVGGTFTTIGALTVNRIARWNGSTWSALGTGLGGTNSGVYTIAIDSSGRGGSAERVYASGSFYTAGGSSAGHVAYWDGIAWNTMGTGTLQGVDVMTVDDLGRVYVAGNIVSAAGGPVNYIARWNGSTWSPLGDGLGGDICCTTNAMVMDTRQGLLIGGFFSGAGGKIANNLAYWNDAKAVYLPLIRKD
jgi:hypothetical protein